MNEKITPSGRKWIAETDVIGYAQKSTPLSTKRQAQEWLDAKTLDSIHGNASERKMSAAIVKGIVEHNDGTKFFGSTMAYTFHVKNAVLRGLINASSEVTDRGLEWYERCLKNLSQNRQVFWDDVGIPIITEKNSMNTPITNLLTTYIEAASDLRSKMVSLENEANELHQFIEIRNKLQAHPEFPGHLPETYFSGGELDPVGVERELGEKEPIEKMRS